MGWGGGMGNFWGSFKSRTTTLPPPPKKTNYLQSCPRHQHCRRRRHQPRRVPAGGPDRGGPRGPPLSLVPLPLPPLPPLPLLVIVLPLLFLLLLLLVPVLVVLVAVLTGRLALDVWKRGNKKYKKRKEKGRLACQKKKKILTSVVFVEADVGVGVPDRGDLLVLLWGLVVL